MNREQIEKTLEEAKKIDLQIPMGHKLRLRAALLEYGSKHQASIWFWFKDKIKLMANNFKPVSFVAGALAGVLIFSGVQFANNSPYLAEHNPFATKKAQAQAAVKQAMFKAKLLSSEDRAKIEANMKADMQSSLEEAYKAKDLTISDESEMRTEGKEGNFTFALAKPGMLQPGAAAAGSVSSGMISSEANAKMEVKKYLKYTDSQNRQVVLGLNEEGVPVFKMMHIQISEGDKQRIEQEMKATGAFGFAPVGVVDIKATGTLNVFPINSDENMSWQVGTEAQPGVRLDMEGQAGSNIQFDKVINIIGE